MSIAKVLYFSSA